MCQHHVYLPEHPVAQVMIARNENKLSMATCTMDSGTFWSKSKRRASFAAIFLLVMLATFHLKSQGLQELLCCSKNELKIYQDLNRCENENGVEAPDVGIRDEGCRDGEHLHDGQKHGAGRRGGRDSHVHCATQVAHHVHAVADVDYVAEPYQDCKHAQIEQRTVNITRVEWGVYFFRQV